MEQNICRTIHLTNDAPNGNELNRRNAIKLQRSCHFSRYDFGQLIIRNSLKTWTFFLFVISGCEIHALKNRLYFGIHSHEKSWIEMFPLQKRWKPTEKKFTQTDFPFEQHGVFALCTATIDNWLWGKIFSILSIILLSFVFVSQTKCSFVRPLKVFIAIDQYSESSSLTSLELFFPFWLQTKVTDANKNGCFFLVCVIFSLIVMFLCGGRFFY